MDRFCGNLIVKVLRNGAVYELVTPFGYHRLNGESITVPAGFKTDFASIPRAFWRILPPFGRYTYAAVIHDYLCDVKDRPSPEAHQIFLEALETSRVRQDVRWVLYNAVKAFGPKF